MSLPALPGATRAAAFAAALLVRHLAQLYLARRSGSFKRIVPFLARRKVKGARSGYASTALLFVSYVAAMLLALGGLARGTTPLAAAVPGGVAWLAAVALRMWALAHLAEQFSSLVEIRDGHRLVTTGPYAVTRHPLHLAFGLEVGAMGLLAWSALAAAPAALVWVVILVRNRTEEAALRGHFGEEYESYRARVPSMDFVRGLARLVMRRGRG